MEPMSRVQILGKAVCVSLHVNAQGKGMNPFYPQLCFICKCLIIILTMFYGNFFSSLIHLSLIYMHLYDVKYSYLIQMIFKQIYLNNIWDLVRVKVDLGVLALKQWFHDLQSQKNGDSQPDAVYFYNKDKTPSPVYFFCFVGRRSSFLL